MWKSKSGQTSLEHLKRDNPMHQTLVGDLILSHTLPPLFGQWSVSNSAFPIDLLYPKSYSVFFKHFCLPTDFQYKQ